MANGLLQTNQFGVPVKADQPKWLGMLQQPGMLGLASGLLSQAAPSMTEPRSLAGGFSQGLDKYSQMQDQAKGRQMQQEQLNLQKQKVAAAQAEQARKVAQEQEQRKAMMQFILGDGDMFEAPAESNRENKEYMPDAQNIGQFPFTEQKPLNELMMSPAVDSLDNIVGGGPLQSPALNNPPTQPDKTDLLPGGENSVMNKYPQLENNALAYEQQRAFKEDRKKRANAMALMQAGYPKEAMNLMTKERDPTTLEKNAEAAGYIRGTPEYQQFIRDAVNKPSTQVNINDKMDSSLSLERFKDMYKRNDSNNKTRNLLFEFEQVLDNLEAKGVNTGFGTGKKLLGRQVDLATIGITDPEIASELEKAQNLQKQLFVEGIGGISAKGQNVFTEKLVREAMPQMETTTAGNRKLIALMRSELDDSDDELNAMEDFYEKNSNLRGFSREWQKERAKRMELKRNPEAIGGFDFVDKQGKYITNDVKITTDPRGFIKEKYGYDDALIDQTLQNNPEWTEEQLARALYDQERKG